MKIRRALSDNLKRFEVVQNAVDVYHLTRKRIQGTYDRTRLFKHINLQTNNICNRDCYFCEYGIPGRKQKNQIMTDALFDKIISELVSLDYRDRISLFEINEPLTDKRIFKLLKEATTRLPLAWHTLTSNGDLMTMPKMMQLFEAGLDQLYLSSYDEKGLSHNLGLIAEAGPSMAFRLIHVDMVTIPEQKLDNRAGLVQLGRKARLGNGRPCERVEKQMIIKPNGTVHSCSSDFFGTNLMGDVNEKSLLDIWFGAPFEELREKLRQGQRDVSPLCAKCDYAGYGGFYDNTPEKRPARVTALATVSA